MSTDMFGVFLYLFVGAGYSGICTLVDLAHSPETQDANAVTDTKMRFVLRTLFWPFDLLVRLFTGLVHLL